MLESVASGDYEIKILQGERVKIQTKSPESYSTIYKELKNRSTEFFTYQPKQERSFRVVLKRIHPSTSTDDIKQALEDLHHKPNNIWNVKNTKTRKPLPIFFIDLQPNPNNKHVYSIKSLLNCRVEIEPPKPKREIPQCSNCQQYGHTQKFCHRQSRCVKCAESHHTKNCPRKERSDKVKCILCEGNHPANYKGCIVYKELQNIKYPNTQPNKQKLKRTEKPEAIVNQTQTKAEFTGPKSHMQILWKATRQRIQPTLNNRLTLPRGRELLKSAQSGHMNIISTGQPTYWPTDKDKIPDIVDFCIFKGIANTNISCSSCWDLSSDHSPILVEITAEIRKLLGDVPYIINVLTGPYFVPSPTRHSAYLLLFKQRRHCGCC
ncbi:Nucleic-acid-binding protein from transposon X-element [Eumeta japonica]|uniref:Nucleic-acid-binding protein from transposon X-element n=1 Tax=Eumeta variegata TaxID=151549 RepID=A0A4C1XMG1_EUMVA|nr:Nucleic-acid-binding protein from transposon X-element [Eumeta japonica]